MGAIDIKDASRQLAARVGWVARACRARAGLTQGQVAALCGRSQAWVSAAEQGRADVGSGLALVHAIAEAAAATTAADGSEP